MVTEEDSGTDAPRLVGETRHDGAEFPSWFRKNKKKSEIRTPDLVRDSRSVTHFDHRRNAYLQPFGELLKHAAGQIFGTFGVRHTF